MTRFFKLFLLAIPFILASIATSATAETVTQDCYDYEGPEACVIEISISDQNPTVGDTINLSGRVWLDDIEVTDADWGWMAEGKYGEVHTSIGGGQNLTWAVHIVHDDPYDRIVAYVDIPNNEHDGDNEFGSIDIDIQDRECPFDVDPEYPFCIEYGVAASQNPAVEGSQVTLTGIATNFGEPLSGSIKLEDLTDTVTGDFMDTNFPNYEVTITVPMLADLENNYIDLDYYMSGSPDGHTMDNTIRIYITPAEVTVIDDAVIEKVSQNIANFQYTRANQLLSLQPDLACRFDGSCQGTLAVDVSGGQANVAFRSGGESALWSELTASITTEGEVESDYALFAMGYDRKVTSNLLLGGLFEFDYAESQFDGAKIKGTGYLVGPYFVYQSDGGGLKLDGRALMGQSSNTYTSDAGIDQDFTTKRALISLGVESEFDMGNGLTLRPRFQGAYVKDSLDAFEIELGGATAPIEANSIEVFQTTAALNFTKEIDVATGSMSLAGGVSAVGSKSEGTGSATGVVPMFENYRGKLELGINRAISDNLSFHINGGYDGIGQENYASQSVSFGMEYAF